MQWRLADFGGEALLTLALERYTQPEISLAELQEVLTRYPDNLWMLDTLTDRRASSLEKELAMLSFADGHVKVSARLIRNHEWFSAQMYTDVAVPRDTFQPVLEQLRGNYLFLAVLAALSAGSEEKQTAYLAIAQAHPKADDLLARFGLARRTLRAKIAPLDPALFAELYGAGEAEVRQALAANPTLDLATCQMLYGNADPAVWCRLAGNPATPTELLQQLANVQQIDHAHHIRTAARAQLKARRVRW